MTKSNERGEQLAFRFPKALIERLDRYAARLSDEHPGLEFSRSERRTHAADSCTR